MKVVCLLLLATVTCAANAEHWAVLVAGSKGWYNYRHQADVCHSYQVVRKYGIKDENIIVMMYDDIANNQQNPTPGIIINHPDGDDVYKNVPHDYTGNDVTPENFVNVLTGNSVHGKKVLGSGPDDNVFVFFADHGAKGLIAFPEDVLKASVLKTALHTMHAKKMYKKLVFYLEACEAGSMFYRDLPDDISIYAMTAANPGESSYACYLDDKRDTYLGDVFSVKWMEDSDAADVHKETIKEQFYKVRNETTTSHVMEYGDLEISKQFIGEFQGDINPSVNYFEPRLDNAAISDSVPSPDVPIKILELKISKSKSALETIIHTAELKRQLAARGVIDSVMLKIVAKACSVDHSIIALVTAKNCRCPLEFSESVLADDLDSTQRQCYDVAVDTFHDRCFNLGVHSYALRKLPLLSNMCELGVGTDRLRSAIEAACVPELRDIVFTN